MPITSFGTEGFVATGKGIELVHLVALRGALRLEAVGMKRRGMSALQESKRLLGMKPKHSREEVLARLEKRIVEVRELVKAEGGRDENH